MATRFKLPGSGTPGLTPALRHAWTHVQASRVTRPMAITNQGTAFVSTSYSPDAADHTVAGASHFATFVSPAVGAQTIPAQTVALSVLCNQINASNALVVTWHLYAVDAADVLRGTLVNGRLDTTVCTTGINYRTDSVTSTAVTTQDGDRLVLEIGLSGTPVAAGGTNGHNGTMRFGDNLGTDIPASDTGNTDAVPWIELATTTLTWAGAGGSTGPAKYDDSRYLYEIATLSYDGMILVPGMTGAQVSGSATLVARASYRQTLAGVQVSGLATLTARTVIKRALAGAQVSGSATLTTRTIIRRALAGAQVSGSATLTARAILKRALAGAQVSSSATLDMIITRGIIRQTVVGAQVSGSGSLILLLRRTLTGAQPAGPGTLTPHRAYAQTLTGDQGAQDTGQLTRSLHAHRRLEGDQPIEPGQLTPHITYHRTVTGVQPAGTASVATHRYYRKTLTGFQPAYTQITYDQPGVLYDDFSYTYEILDAGHLQWRVFFLRVLVGVQPEPTGELGWAWNPYIWAQYTSGIYPDRVEYIATFETEITDVRYDADEQALHQSAPETVYVFKGPQLYTRKKVKP